MPGVGELIVILLILLVPCVLALWLWTIVDCAKNEIAPTNDRLTWILVIVLTGFVGALIYLGVRRPQRMKQLGR